MDHRYIDEHLVADRYLDRVLAPQESGEFEAHLVDCLECRDRLLLAEMFHARNGVSKRRQPPLEEPTDAPAPPRVRLVTRFAASQIALIFAAAAAAAIVLLLALAGLFLWAVS
jgi:anti-sigma factor RsiW